MKAKKQVVKLTPQQKALAKLETLIDKTIDNATSYVELDLNPSAKKAYLAGKQDGAYTLAMKVKILLDKAK